MTENNDAAIAELLARFPLSRVSEAFHDDMLSVLPPVHVRGMPGFLVSEAVARMSMPSSSNAMAASTAPMSRCAALRPGSPTRPLLHSMRAIPTRRCWTGTRTPPTASEGRGLGTGVP